MTSLKHSLTRIMITVTILWILFQQDAKLLSTAATSNSNMQNLLDIHILCWNIDRHEQFVVSLTRIKFRLSISISPRTYYVTSILSKILADFNLVLHDQNMSRRSLVLKETHKSGCFFCWNAFPVVWKLLNQHCQCPLILNNKHYTTSIHTTKS